MEEPTRDDDSVSLDAVLELLASRWCRYVLYELQDDDSLAQAEVVRQVAVRECDFDSDSHPDPDSNSTPRPLPDQCETVRVQLHHDTLPKLEAHDIVERDGDEVATGEYAPLVAPYVEWARKWEVDQ